MPSYLPYLLETLSRLESKHNDRGFAAHGIGAALLRLIFEDEWYKKHVEPNANPDPWMNNGNDAWRASHPVPAPDLRPIIHANRVVRLSDALFTILEQKLQGFETLRQRFLTRNDTRASFFEAEVASLLVYNGCSVRVVGELGIRGQDFDLEAKVLGVPVSVEVTAITKGPLTIKTVLNKLKGKRDQVPPDRPAVLYVHIPENWMRQRSMAVLVLDTAIRRFMLRSRRYNIIVFIWEAFEFTHEGGTAHMWVQPVYNNRARLGIPDYTVFSLKRDKWGMQRNSKSFLDSLRTFRMKPKVRNKLD